MTRICFVSYEIAPTTAGGCGVLLNNAAHVLLQQGHQLIFLLDMPYNQFIHFRDTDRLYLPNPKNCTAYHVETVAEDIPYQEDVFNNIFLWRSYRFYWATHKIITIEQPDILEFFDYGGIAHYTLAAKLTKQFHTTPHLTIRLHTSLEIMDIHEPTKPHNYERYLLFSLEHQALRLAETILYPSENYLNESYKPHYSERWLGQLVASPPPLVNIPRASANNQTKSVILFFGRLFSLKGVDLFVEAGVSLLTNEVYAPDTRLVLAGYDSRQPPDGSATYQEYLLKKIPDRYRHNFEFVGQITWEQLENLLPQVLYAVFPNHFESFGYAVHELYQAGLPLILNDIPAFRDYFEDGQNALFFDGSLANLAQKMRLLYEEATLRQEITHPYPVIDLPLGNFYDEPIILSWMSPSTNTVPEPKLLICILTDGSSNEVEATLASLGDIGGKQVALFTPLQPEQNNHAATTFLGRLYNVHDREGTPILPHELKTTNTLLIVKAGDQIKDNYLEICLNALQFHAELSFVGCWKRIDQADEPFIDVFPFDAAAELIPIRGFRWLNRAVMRTEPNQLLVDLFDPRLADLGEVGYLWTLEETIGPGVIIPEVFIELTADLSAPPPNPNLISYLLLNNTHITRQKRLSRYLISHLLESDPDIPADMSWVMVEKLSADLEMMKATKGWQLLEKYWQIRENIKTTLGKLVRS